ncbi:type II toxin-antitoxin system VapC family toxin [Candidatus Chloroploca sp. Khr17]|uniref:type II toxin-antitoxin system VapC family toxin n=1 Tax=Candidatus Chloroploca sp. Khr17 TaxID=2496869 RepID=UPI00101DDF67|nr:type II toxin-antitoxin system VapC family toxin [Candidatus Chloroploca sp. Khr17]
MNIFFLDSSALTKRYLQEIGSGWVVELTDPAAGTAIMIAEITRVEVAAALAARCRAGAIGVSERDDLVSLVLRHCDEEYQLVAIEPTVTSKAVALTQRHRLRGYDAVQLAAALVSNELLVAADVPALIFVTADADLITAARAEGLRAENPNQHL